ncbi:hypothetical protein [Rhodovulum euryhalinum]|uniref:FlgN protein n=1 Tax=Rhodovulum euryhalinum TaxID=35805 RepID=A0A4R2KI99_9RHOB|nr:hypothetical protein [Rhodovulum euryhalinum]TCO73353.1 hypothetical protein EV655_102117 [Rhodovulum euryhalinum]
MTTDDPIEDLLLRERAALRRADFPLLNALAEEKERMVAELAAHPVTDPATLARLRALAERNAELIEAVRRGVDAAMATLRRARQPAEPLSTYDQSGQTSKIGATQGSLTRRA